MEGRRGELCRLENVDPDVLGNASVDLFVNL